MTTASEPAWLKAARGHFGTREIPGPTHNNRLIAFLNTASRWNGVIWRDDEMPWCGGFAAACLVEVGIEPPKIAARAASWAGWGARLRVERLSPGAIMVYSRPGGHHVNFYTGEDERYFYGIGGNQKNAVNETRIARNRLIASRWPRGVPVIGGPVSRTAAAGTSVSDNEA